MILKRFSLRNLLEKAVLNKVTDPQLLISGQANLNQISNINSNNCKNLIHRQQYNFGYDNNNKFQGSVNKITQQIQKATSATDLKQTFDSYRGNLNFIHRTVFLQKATMKPFDNDPELIQQIIQDIKKNWRYDFPAPDAENSRAIANTICYMSRKKKLHHLDSEFCQIDFFQLAVHINPKQFVMMFNGLIKLQLIDKIKKATRGKFDLEQFVMENVNDKFIPPLLVSIWFNLLKFQKSSEQLNNFFASQIKNRHFKNNLIDYMQVLFCFIKSQGSRNVDLTYPISVHPVQMKQNYFIGAHQLSVLYEQLVNLKKIKQVYFSEQFNYLLESCYFRILNERDIPLRNIANVFKEMVVYESPNDTIMQKTFEKYIKILKNQLTLMQASKANKKVRSFVDSLSFVTVFDNLVKFYKPKHQYLRELISVTLKYVQIVSANQRIMNQYTQKTFARLLSTIEQSKKLFQQTYPQQKITLNQVLIFRLEKQIIRKQFELSNLSKLIYCVYQLNIRSKGVCQKIRKMIQSIPEKNQNNFKQRLNQKCILNKNCSNCVNCFGK